jgi:hypothetical protein
MISTGDQITMVSSVLAHKFACFIMLVVMMRICSATSLQLLSRAVDTSFSCMKTHPSFTYSTHNKRSHDAVVPSARMSHYSSQGALDGRGMARGSLMNRCQRRMIHQTSSFSLKMSSSDILALDFDGVICASADESSSTAVMTAKRLWPDKMTDKDDLMIEKLKEIRPIIETGYESVLLARKMNEMLRNGLAADKLIPEIISNWKPSYRDAMIKEYGSSKVIIIQSYTTYPYNHH